MVSGIEVISSLENCPYVIFSTAFDEYAVKAFELGAIDYLLKPFSLERFNVSIDRFLQAQGQSNKAQLDVKNLGLSFKEKGRHYLVSHEDILYLASNAKHTLIHTQSRSFETARLLKEVNAKLPQEKYQRIHRQFIVNLLAISHIEYDLGGRYLAFLRDDDETTLPVGRKYVAALKSRLGIR